MTQSGIRVGSEIDVLEQGTLNWENARRLFDGSLDRHPSRILRPMTLKGAIKLIASLQTAGEDFTLKSGGHSAAGLSVVNGVTLVDLSSLRGVQVDPDQLRVIVQGGALMSDLDGATQRLQMATTGGTVSHTGVTGLACGGGLGWLMGQFGLACDNIVGASVLTSGEMRVIDESSPEMAVLRGAGTSLGFIAELTLRIHPIQSLFCWSWLRFSQGAVLEAIDELEIHIRSIPDSVGCSITIESDRTGSISGVIDIVAPNEDQSAQEWRNEMAAVAEESGDTLMSYQQLQQALDSQFPFGGRSYRRSLCVDSLQSYCFDGLFDELSQPSPFRRLATVDILHGVSMSTSNREKSCFPRRAFTGVFICQWSESHLDLPGRDAGRRIFERARENYEGDDFVAYGNYSSDPSDSSH